MRQRKGLAVAAMVAAFLTPLVCGKAEAANWLPSADGKGSEAKASPQKKTPGNPAPAPSGRPGEAPVTVEFLGLSSDKEHVRYRIRVNTDKPLEQVDVGLTYTGTNGKRQTETVIWQNIVKSKRQPIGKGNAYEDESYLAPGASGVDCKLLRVVYKDMATWAPAK